MAVSAVVFAVSVSGWGGERDGASVQLVERKGVARMHRLAREKTVEGVFKWGCLCKVRRGTGVGIWSVRVKRA